MVRLPAILLAAVAAGPASAPPATNPPPSVETSLAAIETRLAAIEARLSIVPAAAAAPRPAPASSAAPRIGYPLRSTWWTHPGEIHAHLKSGAHHYKFPPEWVDTLTRAEAEALHSDDHEFRVQWDYVPAGQASAAPAWSPPVTYSVPGGQASACPGGTCPTGRRVIFGRR